VELLNIIIWVVKKEKQEKENPEIYNVIKLNIFYYLIIQNI
jgi:hypothetical protein